MASLRILYTPSGRAGEYANKGLACNLYRGCVHGCRYCYVPGVCRQSREAFHAGSAPAADVISRLEHDCRQRHEEPIFLSFTCDIYQPALLCDVTSEALRIIKQSGNRVRILTKGVIPETDLERLGEGDEVGVTLTFDNPADSRLWEPGAALPAERIVNLIQARRRGIQTWVSFEPVIHPEQTFSLLECVQRWADVVKIGKANHIGSWDWPQEDEWRRLVEGIDWARFARESVALCERLSLPYVLKQDLTTTITEGGNVS